MKQLTLNLSDSEFHAFLEFIKTLNYVEVPEADGNIVERTAKQP